MMASCRRDLLILTIFLRVRACGPFVCLVCLSPLFNLQSKFFPVSVARACVCACERQLQTEKSFRYYLSDVSGHAYENSVKGHSVDVVVHSSSMINNTPTNRFQPIPTNQSINHYVYIYIKVDVIAACDSGVHVLTIAVSGIESTVEGSEAFLSPLVDGFSPQRLKTRQSR
jgi:hypothetical protein